ncbi:FAD-binding oxidoreductase [Oceaniglobus ichthyenteri]|uniref:FAD-binding oxidoreductase n=1 Tax=Oceaniglobus ichthyenteri TaxID=2136177 RepID=UPI000D38007C|nr:FAD-binding oxidoreductase [Oceaniglobus ichthyenteri]
MNSPFNPPTTTLIEAIKTVVGDGGWKAPNDAARYFSDPRDRFTGAACLVALPRTTAQVSEILRLCSGAGAAVIPYGGGTGVVAGQLSIDSDQAVILSLERMNKVRSIAPEDGVMIAEAGCILEDIHNTAQQHGMMFPLGMASQGSCTIGGNLATNAGGIQVVRHGNARDLCLGIEAVLANGDVIEDLEPLRKDNTGYNLRHLLIGSEGTLGIITAATLIVKPVDPETVTALCAINTPADALRLYHRLARSLGNSISGLELMSDFGIGLVSGHFPNLTLPFANRTPWYLLVEASGRTGLRDDVEQALAGCMEDDLLTDAVLAESEGQRANLWALRENTPEANRLTGAICSSDTSVAISKVEAFIDAASAAVKQVHPDLRINSYGHIGDGNIHHNVFPPEGMEKPAFIAANPGVIDAVRNAISEATVQCGGSISAEHGIGRLKTDDLQHYASAAKMEAMRAIKRALDPKGILNPGAVLK